MPEIFQRNYLAEVIARIDFQPALPKLDRNDVEGFSEWIAPLAPIYQPPPTPKFVLQLSAGPIDASHPPDIVEDHTFSSPLHDKRVILSKQALVLVTTSYTSYEPMKTDFLKALAWIEQNHPKQQASRLGLRYINRIDIRKPQPLEWTGLIADPLLSSLDFLHPEEHKALSRIFSTIHVNFGSFRLRFQYGIHNPDFPAPIRQKQFILDYDGFERSLIDLPDVEQLLFDIQGKIWEYFDRSIGPDLKRMMR